MLGVGPGALITDAYMLGIEPNRQREMMGEALDALMDLLTSDEPVTCQTDWFKLVDARIQLRPFTEPYMPIAVASVQSPAGVTLAGKHGLGVITIAHRVGVRGLVDIGQQWRIAEDTAAAHGKQMRRQEWRINLPVHLADSKQQALDDVRERGNSFVIKYQYNGSGSAEPDGGPLDSIVDRLAASGSAIIGTPDDLIATIEHYQEVTGGFGCLLVQVNEWASWEKTRHSYELLARYVMPRFQGSLRNLEASYSQAASHVAQTRSARRAAIEHAHQSYERDLNRLPS
jgi:limonene 1,2-monooxygenase